MGSVKRKLTSDGFDVVGWFSRFISILYWRTSHRRHQTPVGRPSDTNSLSLFLMFPTVFPFLSSPWSGSRILNDHGKEKKGRNGKTVGKTMRKRPRLRNERGKESWKERFMIRYAHAGFN